MGREKGSLYRRGREKVMFYGLSVWCVQVWCVVCGVCVVCCVCVVCVCVLCVLCVVCVVWCVCDI